MMTMHTITSFPATNRPAITTVSLGRACAHELRTKLTAAAVYGFQGVELFYEDLEHLASTLRLPQKENAQASSPSESALFLAAETIHAWCSTLKLTTVNLQPLFFDEGILSRSEHLARLDKLSLWCRLAHTLGTDLIAIPSSLLSADQLSSDLDLIASDLRAAANIAAAQTPPIRLTYEALAWGTRVDTWEKSWEVVRRADIPNLGLCLDTFNICGRIYADPTTASGKVTEFDADSAVTDSAARLVAMVPPDKIFFVQLVDAERLTSPLKPGHPLHNPAQPPRMSWSRNCRLFYGETERGAYLPVDVFVKAIFDKDGCLGWNGWVSMELFHRELLETRPELPRRLAQRGIAAWSHLLSFFEVGRTAKEKWQESGRRIQVARL